ncbi:hypothetical protein M3Y98_01207700 [Aphelenchoides besseyi]|nr:hypothetical protein M3Y98_01207700 [Aphelenchoides besseyi]KAI6193241.1 hypothetical protein M3Y96_00997600 [Aphelenchoides besseyi]
MAKKTKPVETTSTDGVSPKPPIKQKDLGRSQKTATSRKLKASDSPMDSLVATMYFLEWQKNILKGYTESIERLYVIPLKEHCVGKKVINATTTDRETVKADGSFDEVVQLKRCLKRECEQQSTVQLRSLEAKEKGDNEDKYVPTSPEKRSSLAENSVLFHLCRLVEIVGQLSAFMEHIGKWMENNRKILAKNGCKFDDVLSYAILSFEAICAQADVFSLKPVNRSEVRADCRPYIDAGDPYMHGKDRKRNQPLKFGERTVQNERKLADEIEKDVKPLEAQINFYLINNQLIDITQTFAAIVPNDMHKIARELRTIKDRRTPPLFLFPGKIQLTKATEKLLSVSAPSKFQLNRHKESSRLHESLGTPSDIEHSSIVPHSTRSKTARSSSNRRSPDANTPPVGESRHPPNAYERIAKSIKSERTQSDSPKET